MADTTFVDGSTLTAADWFNDVNRLHYTIFGDPATLATAKDALFPAWTTPSFSAGDFTASGSMTWTVAAGDVTTYAYIVNGKMMTVMFSIVTSTVGGTPSTALRIAIPASKTATKQTANPCYIVDANTATTGFALVSASGTTIGISRTDGANFGASTNQTNLEGQITFEIN